MHIVADENIPLLDAFFAPLGRITRLPGRQISHQDLTDADALIVRSVTRVDPQLLAGTPVRFVGTCTIGTDHLDLPGLAAAGVTVASAPGCNARGVVEYVLSCLLTLSERTGLDWRTRRVGIVGVGEVGGRLAQTLTALGVECLLCDPPRAARGEGGFAPLDQLLTECDVISCHVPLTRTGADATWHLLDAGRLVALRPGAWLINSSRGPVIDNHALKAVLAERADLQVALDVWEQEPQVDCALLQRCALGTPHIAGYSL
ncbi:MAG TPA: 4-phosphoerythronate dehydrogenase, partial [Pseudomonas sp.]|nr:4-phosphoerythronate dehydrogenase [Pseudomonas sp.]